MDESRSIDQDNMVHHRTVIFVCEHGAAKSVLAATYFNQLADASNLKLRAIARGTNPDTKLSRQTVEGLAMDGIKPTETIPQKLSMEDVQSAQRIVSFCEIPAEYQGQTIITYWDGIPAVSENYDTARNAIVARLKQLISELRSSS